MLPKIIFIRILMEKTVSIYIFLTLCLRKGKQFFVVPQSKGKKNT